MAALVITAANVISSAPQEKRASGIAGAAIVPGQCVYLDTATNRYKLTDANSVTVAERVVDGISLNTAAIGQPVVVHKGGDLALGAVLTQGVIYVASDAPGSIMPAADLSSGEYVTLLGVATSTTNLRVNIFSSGAALA